MGFTNREFSLRETDQLFMEKNEKRIPANSFSIDFNDEIGSLFCHLYTQPVNTYGNNPPTEVAVTSAPSSSGSTIEISIVNYSFSPETVTIKAGTTVTWTNQDSVVHTVTSDTGVFDSGSLEKGKTFSYTFSTAGIFAYHCAPHQAKMTGTIVVTD